MDGADSGRWSAAAGSGAELWGTLALPFWKVITENSGVAPDARVLDVGCGTGDLLTHLTARGISVAGFDPAPGTVAHARTRVPQADIRLGTAEHLPWPHETYHSVTSINAPHLAADIHAAMRELIRVTVPGEFIGVGGVRCGRTATPARR